MFRTLTKPQDVPEKYGNADAIPRNSSWKPGLRRLPWSPFSSKEGKQDHDFETSDDAAYTCVPMQHLPDQRQGQEGHPQLKAPDPPIYESRIRPKGPRDPPKAFKLFQRSNSRRVATVPDGQDSSRLQKERRYDAPPSKIFQQSASQGNKTLAADSKPRTAYVPTHAASDFSKLKISPTKKTTPAHRQGPKSFPETNDDHSSDYQAFIKAEINNSYSLFSKPRVTTTPKSKQVLDDIISNQQISNHQASVRRSSFYQESVRSRPGSIAGSFRDKMLEYIKPSRPESLYDQRTLDGDGRSVTGSYRSFGGRGNRWSRMGGSIRRSFSRDRDEEDDEARRRNFVGGDGGSGEKRMGRVMPVSPALKKYNIAVKSGNFF